MKVLENVRQRIISELPRCKSHSDVQNLFAALQVELRESKAPFGQRQNMWQEVKRNLATLTHRAEIVQDAHSIIDGILKKMT